MLEEKEARASRRLIGWSLARQPDRAPALAKTPGRGAAGWLASQHGGEQGLPYSARARPASWHDRGLR